MAFKYGGFHNLCKSYEVVLSDGSVVVCDKSNHQDLYAAIPLSYGTLGFLVSTTIDIIPYKPYLKHTYRPVSSLDELVKVFEKEIHDPGNDTVEGIMFSKDKAVVMSGTFVENIEVCRFVHMKRNNVSPCNVKNNINCKPYNA